MNFACTFSRAWGFITFSVFCKARKPRKSKDKDFRRLKRNRLVMACLYWKSAVPGSTTNFELVAKTCPFTCSDNSAWVERILRETAKKVFHEMQDHALDLISCFVSSAQCKDFNLHAVGKTINAARVASVFRRSVWMRA